MEKKRVIGLTGQTGAGKTTVSSFAVELGCAVVDADKVAHEALAPGSDCLKRLAEIFGHDIIEKDGSCRRSVLAQRAFSDKKSTALLNSITHPWIIEKSGQYIRRKLENNDIVIFDAPLLFESGGDRLCGTVIAVTAPENIRIERIIQRDGISEKAARLRMGAQHHEEYYTSRADYVIDGSASLDEIKRKTAAIISEIQNCAALT